MSTRGQGPGTCSGALGHLQAGRREQPCEGVVLVRWKWLERWAGFPAPESEQVEGALHARDSPLTDDVVV